jgi:hypothetical protein
MLSQQHKSHRRINDNLSAKLKLTNYIYANPNTTNLYEQLITGM